jgi:hypothetical protein
MEGSLVDAAQRRIAAHFAPRQRRGPTIVGVAVLVGLTAWLTLPDADDRTERWLLAAVVLVVVGAVLVLIGRPRSHAPYGPRDGVGRVGGVAMVAAVALVATASLTTRAADEEQGRGGSDGGGQGGGAAPEIVVEAVPVDLHLEAELVGSPSFETLLTTFVGQLAAALDLGGIADAIAGGGLDGLERALSLVDSGLGALTSLIELFADQGRGGSTTFVEVLGDELSLELPDVSVDVRQEMATFIALVVSQRAEEIGDSRGGPSGSRCPLPPLGDCPHDVPPCHPWMHGVWHGPDRTG